MSGRQGNASCPMKPNRCTPEEAPSSLPRNVWSFRDGMVLLKPDGWQIYDKVLWIVGVRLGFAGDSMIFDSQESELHSQLRLILGSIRGTPVKVSAMKL